MPWQSATTPSISSNMPIQAALTLWAKHSEISSLITFLDRYVLRCQHQKPKTDQTTNQPTLNTFAALDQPLRSAVRAQIRKDLESNAVPETCLLGMEEVTQHLPMAMQGFSDFYTSLEHCQNCSGEMAEAKIPKNWFYVRSLLFLRYFSFLLNLRSS